MTPPPPRPRPTTTATAARNIIAVIGSTGVGKSQYAVSLANASALRQQQQRSHNNTNEADDDNSSKKIPHPTPRIRPVILSADAMQLYQGLPVITNKVTPEEQAGVEHWGLGVVRLAGEGKGEGEGEGEGVGGSWEVGKWCGEAWGKVSGGRGTGDSAERRAERALVRRRAERASVFAERGENQSPPSAASVRCLPERSENQCLAPQATSPQDPSRDRRRTVERLAFGFAEAPPPVRPSVSASTSDSENQMLCRATARISVVSSDGENESSLKAAVWRLRILLLASSRHAAVRPSVSRATVSVSQCLPSDGENESLRGRRSTDEHQSSDGENQMSFRPSARISSPTTRHRASVVFSSDGEHQSR